MMSKKSSGTKKSSRSKKSSSSKKNTKLTYPTKKHKKEIDNTINELKIVPNVLEKLISQYIGDLRDDVKIFNKQEFVKIDFASRTLKKYKRFKIYNKIKLLNNQLGKILMREKVKLDPERENEFRYVVFVGDRYGSQQILYLYSDDMRKVTDTESDIIKNKVITTPENRPLKNAAKLISYNTEIFDYNDPEVKNYLINMPNIIKL